MSKILKKITIRTVCGAIPFAELIKLPEGERRLDLMAVYGQAQRMMEKTSDLGAYVAFQGNFKAVNLRTGESYRSGKIILPGIVTELIAGALDGSQAVDFAFSLGIEYDDTVATKYVYTCESLREVEETDALAVLEKEIAKKLPVLPAPKVEQLPAPAEQVPASQQAPAPTTQQAPAPQARSKRVA